MFLTLPPRGLTGQPLVAIGRGVDQLIIQNRATHPRRFEEAPHTYFAISDISDAVVFGLASTTYIDKTDMARRKRQTEAVVTVAAETDGVYLDTPRQCAIGMGDLGDPAWRSMICVETGNIADNEVRLAADNEHQMSTTISVHAGPQLVIRQSPVLRTSPEGGCYRH